MIWNFLGGKYRGVRENRSLTKMLTFCKYWSIDWRNLWNSHKHKNDFTPGK